MNMIELIREIELIKGIDGHSAKVTATPIKEEAEYGDRIIGGKYEIIVMMNEDMVTEDE